MDAPEQPEKKRVRAPRTVTRVDPNDKLSEEDIKRFTPLDTPESRAYWDSLAEKMSKQTD